MTEEQKATKICPFCSEEISKRNKYKFFKYIILCFVLVIGINSAFAVNHTYKVYNPRTNKVYNAVFGTLSITDTQYLWGFYTEDGIPICVAQIYNAKEKNGLINGTCTEVNAFLNFLQGKKVDLNKYNMSWRELSKDTIYNEMESIRQERAYQGKYEYQGK